MVSVEDVLLYSVAQAGDRYRFGAEVDFNDPDPDVFDCSELVEWACHRAGVIPQMPDGSWVQARHCHQHGADMAVGDAVATRGALLFKFTKGVDPFTVETRPDTAHVAWSLGNGTTIEAKGTRFGVGSWTADPAKRGWTHAARIPGVDFTVPRPQLGAAAVIEEEEEMNVVLYFKGPSGDVHPYVVTGGIGKHLSAGAVDLHTFFHTPVKGSPTEGLGQEWQDGVALLDGPLQNIH